MNKNLQEYNCEEYFEDHYKNGLFHPTECQIIFSHNDYRFDSYNEDMIIGGVYDDVDLLLCYRKGFKGLWGRNNQNKEYWNMHSTLKQFTERYYQKSSQFWRDMKADQIWKEVLNFYRMNLSRYDWNINQYINLIEKFIESETYKNIFIKGYKESLDISSTNGFGTRPNKNMVKIYLAYSDCTYNILFMANYFNEVKRREFNEENYEEIIELTNNWIKIE